MPTRAEQRRCTDVVNPVDASATEPRQSRLRECQSDDGKRSRHRSRSSHSTSSSSSASSSSSGSTSGSSSETTVSDSSSSSRDSTDKMAAGSSNRSRGTTQAVPNNLQQHSDENDTQRRKHSPGCSKRIVDGRSRSPPSPAVKPEVETKTTSGTEVADIVCLSPSKIEAQTSDVCSVIPTEMTSGLSENGNRNKIRIVLGGKLFPVPVSQLRMSDSLRSISLYSDEEVDCNDDGRSLDRPTQRTITSQHLDKVHLEKLHQDVSKCSTETQCAGKVEVSQSNVDRVSTVKDSKPKEVNDAKTKTAVSLSKAQDLRQNATHVDDRSRYPQRQRLSTERRDGQMSSREERRRHGSCGRKDRSPEVDRRHECFDRRSLNSAWGRRSQNEQGDGNIVAVDRDASCRQRTAAQRYTDISPRHESRTGTVTGHRREVSSSRSRLSRDRRECRSRSRSPSRRDRDETGSRSRTIDHRPSRTEVDERQRRWSKYDSTSVSGRHTERQTWSTKRPDVNGWYRRPDQLKEPYHHHSVTPTVPEHWRRTGYGDRSIISSVLVNFIFIPNRRRFGSLGIKEAG